MLSSFRGVVKGIGGVFFAALVILAFAFVGVPEFRNFTQRNALEVGKAKFSANEVRTEFSRQVEQYNRGNDQNLTSQEAAQMGLLDRTLEVLIARSSLAQETERLKLVATDEMILDYLESEPAFQNPTTGEFDQQYLAQILQLNGLTLNDFRNDIEAELIRNQLLDSIGAAMPAPAYWVEMQLIRQGESRDVAFARLAPEPGTVTDPTPEELQGYYEAHADEYMAPEYRTFRVVTLRNGDFAGGLERSEDELRQLFATRQQYLSTPELRTVRQLTYQSEAEAQAAADRLNAGTPFEELAEDQGLNINRVTYEEVREDDLADPAIAAALFAEDEIGATVGPIDGLFGYTVGQVLEITPAEQAVFEDVREELAAELNEDETSRRLFDAIELIELARDEGAPLEEAIAEVEGVELVTWGPVDRNLFTPDGSIINDLPVEVLNEAFMMEPGDESQFIDTEERDGYFAVILDEVQDPQVKPLAEVRDQVSRAYLAERRRNAGQERLAALRAAMADGTGFADAVESIGATVVETTLAGAQNPENLPPEFINNLYEGGIGSLVTGESEGGYVYAGVVTEASFAAMPQQQQLIDFYKTSAGQQLSVELTDAYVTTLQNELKVKQNQDELNRMLNVGVQ